MTMRITKDQKIGGVPARDVLTRGAEGAAIEDRQVQ